MVKKKLFAGVGAKCSILTKFLHPKQQNFAKDHRSDVVLIGEEKRIVNRKEQECYRCKRVGEHDTMHAVKKHFKVLEEGEPGGIFDKAQAAERQAERRQKGSTSEKENKIKWKKSEAKKLLYNLILEGVVPRTAKDENGRPRKPGVQEIFLMELEFSKYNYEKFPSRLAALRKKIQELDNRAREDLLAFENYKKNHKPSLFSHKGYIQWQGSTAQELLDDDIEAGLHKKLTPQELCHKR